MIKVKDKQVTISGNLDEVLMEIPKAVAGVAAALLNVVEEKEMVDILAEICAEGARLGFEIYQDTKDELDNDEDAEGNDEAE